MRSAKLEAEKAAKAAAAKARAEAKKPPKDPEPPRKKRKASPPKEPAAKAKLIRLYPSAKIKNDEKESEKDKLTRWFGAARWTYNECLTAIQKGLDTRLVQKIDDPSSDIELPDVLVHSATYRPSSSQQPPSITKIPNNMAFLRKYLIYQDALEAHPSRHWLKEVPGNIREEALNDFRKALTTCFSLLRDQHIKKFDMKYRCRKKLYSESIVIPGRSWSQTKGEYAFLRSMKSAEALPVKLDYDTRLVHRRNGQYFLAVLSPLSSSSSTSKPDGKAPENQRRDNSKGKQVEIKKDNHQKKIASIDPGVRTFATIYEPDGSIVEWGRHDIGRIYRLAHYVDKLQSQWTKKIRDRHNQLVFKMKAHQRWRFKRAASRLREKIRNLIKDLHCKMARWLCSTYDYILLPVFETQTMIRRSQRRIHSKTARAMVTWSHYSFRQRLLSKARAFPGCRVVLVDEAYTSKTCGLCGYVHRGLGGSKVFSCPRCRALIDRDHNGARNILLRFLSLPS